MPKSKESIIAANQFAKKLKLEEQLKPHLYRFFTQIGRDVAAVWIATQNIPNLSSFHPELISMLRAHYRRVAKAFSNETRDNAKSYGLDIETKAEENEAAVGGAIVLYINEHSKKQADIILNTTERELQEIAARQIAESYSTFEPLDNVVLGNEIKKEFAATADSRVDTIAMTETQMSSETIKLIEAIAVERAVQSTGSKRKLIKTWNTRLDEKTRPSHVAADRQQRNVNEPFIVQGQKLMVPGDTSLGATIDNWINCRCSSITSFSDEEAPIMAIPE